MALPTPTDSDRQIARAWMRGELPGVIFIGLTVAQRRVVAQERDRCHD